MFRFSLHMLYTNPYQLIKVRESHRRWREREGGRERAKGITRKYTDNKDRIVEIYGKEENLQRKCLI